MIEFTMPSLGADMEAGTLREWKVKPGDKVKRGDIIAEVETQKGIIEIEVFNDGTIGKLLIDLDQKVPVGTVMAHILAEGETMEAPKVLTETEGAKEKTTTDEQSKKRSVKASPLARKIAKENRIDISTIKSSNADGTISVADVEKVIAENETDNIAKETSPLSNPSEGIRMAVAAAMSRSNKEIPHYYLETKIDVSSALTLLTKINKKLPVSERLLNTVLLIKAVAKALEEVPDLNAWWINGLQKKQDINIGFVVSLRTGGIVVPTIHHVSKKTVKEIMQSLNDIIPRARALKLRSSELSDSTITVTSLGDKGVETVYGVIYPPQVAIVGFGKIKEEACVLNNTIIARPILTATLAADHRATDGSTGSKFLLALKKFLENPELL